jgi:hypothetical protein
MTNEHRRRILSSFLLGLGAFVAGRAPPATAAAAEGRAASPQFRRVIAGVDAGGHSTIVADGPVPTAAQWTFSDQELESAPFLRGISGNELWIFNGLPADPTDTSDPLLGKLPDDNQPPRGGVIARIHRFAPGTVYPMHRTDTVDLNIIISGRMELGLEAGSAVLAAGDVAVQRRTRHSWRVIGDEPCVFVAVMFDAVATA